MAPKIKRYVGSRELREWALSLSDEDKKRLGIQGIEVSNRGRFHSKLVQAFNRDHRQQGIRYVPIARDVPKTEDAFEAADKGDSDEPEVYRQPRQEAQPKEEVPVPPTPIPVPQAVAAQPQATVQAPTVAAPAAVMELLRSGQNVVVIYVPVEMAAAV